MTDTAAPPLPSLEEMQRWTWVMGRMQQAMLEAGIEATRMTGAPADDTPGFPVIPGFTDPDTLKRAEDFWGESVRLWQRFVAPESMPDLPEPAGHERDKRFKAEAWRDHPLFDWIRRSYFLVSDHLMAQAEAVPVALRAKAEYTLTRLKLRDGERVLRWRRSWYALYQNRQITLEGLRKVAPLLAAAVGRAGT